MTGNALGLLVRAIGTVALSGATRALLSRMSRDFDRHHQLQTSTMLMVYSGYGMHAAILGHLVHRPVAALPVPRALSRSVGPVLVGAGAALFLSGAGAFRSAEQLSGTDTGELITDGIYQWTRNPQYLGHLLTSAGTSIIGRSGDGLALTCATAVVFDHWIQREEANLSLVFGRRYGRYQEHSPRWIGAPPAVGR